MSIDKQPIYLKLFQKLLPPGVIWNRRLDSNMGKLCAAIADELNRLDARIEDLFREADPRTTDELLVDWERVLGLPDECSPLAPTTAERRLRVVQKLVNPINGQNIQFYIDAAAAIGKTITVNDIDDSPQAFLVGRNTVGQALNNSGGQHVATFTVPANQSGTFKVGQNTVGEPLIFFGDTELECLLNKLKPAHAYFNIQFV